MSTVDVEIIIQPKRRGKPRQDNRSAPVAGTPRIPRIARLMALTIKFQEMVDRGEVRDYADLARLGYVTRARITQIMNLLNLAPDLQEALLISPTPAAQASLPERGLRHITAVAEWSQQRRLWKELLAPSPQPNFNWEGTAVR
jgi:hypothetical protein